MKNTTFCVLRFFRLFGTKVLGLMGVGIIVLSSSCSKSPQSPGYEYMPNMYRSPSYETYSPNPNFADGMTARKPVEGTVPLGFMPYTYPNTVEGYEAAGRELKNPVTSSSQVLEEGKTLFTTYCSHCHGLTGAGDGAIIQNGKFPPPPSFQGPLKELPEGKMFHSITYGKNLMGAHASQLTNEERWKIIHYLQTLQKL